MYNLGSFVEIARVLDYEEANIYAYDFNSPI